MYNAININPDSVEFEATVGGYNQIVNLERPDGVSYSQWSGVWSGFKELHDSRQYSLDDYVERQVDTSAITALEDENDDLKEEVRVLQADLDAAEIKIASLEDDKTYLENELNIADKENEALEAELRQVNYRLESLEK